MPKGLAQKPGLGFLVYFENAQTRKSGSGLGQTQP
jgi:hypothetical protein